MNIVALGKFNNLWVIHEKIKPIFVVVQLSSSNNESSLKLAFLKLGKNQADSLSSWY